ncbi:MAG: PhzF family phenazine biosynthesis protein [Bacteroidales bacterium]|jgi:predicted PhzF superfamily epimerase YddE/YHI9|nr:PhzF family phenazine biosynthesis protein [Bacteroidales bacterium]
MILYSYHVDAFTDELFKGNPACVIPLDNWLKDDLMLKIAAENGVAETAFFIKNSCTEGYSIRWFTPDIEMDLCGHATLATAFVISTIFEDPTGEILFTSAGGELRVVVDNGLFTLDFPSRPALPATLPRETYDSLSIKPLEVLKERDYLLIYASQQQIEEIEIDRNLFDRVNMDPGGVIITAPASEPEVDFVSRFFTPQSTILEDPVTGSAHCTLIPYWSARLGKRVMTAKQISPRGGTLFCEDCGDRVLISGTACLYSKGMIRL